MTKEARMARLFDRVKELEAAWKEDVEPALFDREKVEKWQELMTESIGDCGLSSLALFHIMKRYPEKRQWEDGNLEHMNSETMEALYAEAKKNAAKRKEPKKNRK